MFSLNKEKIKHRGHRAHREEESQIQPGRFGGLTLLQLVATETASDVIVHHSGGLHQGIADCGTCESKSAFLQILAHGVGLRGPRRDVLRTARPALFRLSSGELPEVSIKAAELALYGEIRLRVRNGRGNLQSVSNDPRISEQGPYFPRAVFCDLCRVESIEHFAVSLALSQDCLPAQPGLRAFENQEFEQCRVVVDGHTPFLIMVADHEVALRPMTPAPGQLAGPGAIALRHGIYER